MELTNGSNVANLRGNGTASQLLGSLTHPKGSGKALTPEEMEKRHDSLTKQSQRLVSQTFFGAMLKEMRNSPFKSEIFDGGRGGEAFSSMLDQRLADRMAVGAGNKLSRSIVNKIEHVPPSRKHKAPPKGSAMHHAFKRSSYAKPAGIRRPNVTADFRA